MAQRKIIIRYYRNGKLDESLKSLRGYLECVVFLGEERIGAVIPGHTESITINEDSYVLTLRIWNPVERMEYFTIPADSHPNFGPKEYIYNVKVDDALNNVKNFSKTLFKGIATKFVAGESAAQRLVQENSVVVAFEEDPIQKKKNEDTLNTIKQIDGTVYRILHTLKDEKDYSVLNSLPDNCKNSDYYKYTISRIANSAIKDSVKYYNEFIWDVRIVMSYLENLASLPGGENYIRKLLKNKSYFCPTEERINDGAIESILPSNDPVSALEELDAKNIPILKKPLLTQKEVMEKFSNLPNDQKALNICVHLITKDIFEKEDLDALKKWLLFYGVYREGASADDAATYRVLLEANQFVFHPSYKIGEEFKLGKTVDMLIAEAIRCSRSGSFDDYDKDLEEFLRYSCPFRGVDKTQYDILLKIFAHLNAFKEEKMVLQAMVDNMIERTPEQEARLSFLKNNDISSDSVKDFSVVENNSETGSFIYEYRTLNWNSKEIQDYFVSHSAQGKFDDNMSYVVAEWSKTINSSITWDTESVMKEIDRELKENYGDRLQVGIVKSGANSEWVEYLDSIYICEKDTEKKEYRWLQFNISGENITRKQIHIMVQALYWPGVDSSVIHLDDVYSKNSAAAKKTVALREKQNPRWNVFINSIVEIVVGEIEKWINSSGDTSSIY